MSIKILGQSLLAATLLMSAGGCYAVQNRQVEEVRPESGVWHLDYTGEGEEIRDYSIAFQPNGDVIVFEGDLRHDNDGRNIVNNTSPVLTERVFTSRNHWERGTAVLHTIQEYSTGGLLVAHEYHFNVQDAHTLVGEVVVTSRVNGIYSRSTFKASARFVARRN